MSEEEKQQRLEFSQLMAGLKSNFPNWNFNLTDKAMLGFWYEALKDIPFDVLRVGIYKVINQEEFYPNIAKIRKACLSITQGPSIDETEAWGLVKKAIRMYGYPRAEEALASLPIDVAKAVVAMGGWMDLCSSVNTEADRAHFYRTMQALNERQHKENILALGLREQIKVLKHEEVDNRKCIALNETYKRPSEETTKNGLESVKSVLLTSLGIGDDKVANL